MKSPRQEVDPSSITRKEIRTLLRNWGNSKKLGQHRLAHLSIVEGHRIKAKYGDTDTGRALALKDLLQDAVDSLRPDGETVDLSAIEGDEAWLSDERWRHYLIVELQYIRSFKPGYVEELIHIEQRWYHEKQGEALDIIAARLMEAEENPTAPAINDFSAVDRLPNIASPPDVPNFVGREEELAYFRNKLDELNYIVITGAPGAGKTSLAVKLSRQITNPRQVFWYKCHEGDGADSLIWALAGFLANQGQGELWQILNMVIANDREAMPFSMRVSYAIKLLAEGDYLLCLDDFQYLDTDKDIVQLVRRLFELVEANQLKLIITSHRVPSFIRQRFELLEGLTEDDASQLVVAQGLSLEPEQLVKLYEITEGHALFLNLGISALKETPMRDILLSTLPEDEKIDSFLLEAIDEQLSDDERKVMEAISILGDESGGRFLLETIVGEGGIRRSLQSLSERNLVTIRLSEKGREYSQHAIVRTYFYDGLGLIQQREMHGRAAEYYTSLELNAFLATTHYAKAGLHSRTIEIITAQTRWLINQGHAQALVDLFPQIKLDGFSVEMQARFDLAQGQIRALLGERETAQSHYQRALSNLEILGVSIEIQELRGRICRGMGELLQHEAPEEALVWLRRGVKELGGNSQREEAALLIKTSSVEIALGNYRTALETVKTGQQMLPNEPDPLHISAFINLGNIHSSLGDMIQGQTYTLKGLELSRQFGLDFMALGALHNLAIHQHISGDWESATANYTEALALAEWIGNVGEQVAIKNSLGILHTAQGNNESAHIGLKEALDLTRTNQFSEEMAYVLQSLADLQIRQEEWDKAEKDLAEAEALAQALNLRYLFPELYLGWAKLYLGRGQLTEARLYTEQALNHARELELEREIGMSQRVMGIVLWSNEQYEAAEAAFEESLTLLQSIDPYETARTQISWGNCLYTAHDKEKGESLLEEARRTFEQIGASYANDQMRLQG